MLMNRRRMMYKIYEEAKEFAQEFIAPYAKKCDEEAIFPVESFQKMGEKGYFNLLIPEQYGGLGKGLEEHSQVCMAFAEASATASLCYMMHNVGLHCVMTYGSDTLKEKIAKDVVENHKFFALAYSEFETGTHFIKSQLEVNHTKDGAIFNGSKSMVTSATHASYYLIGAPAKKEGESNNWVVSLDTEGVTFKDSEWKGMGMRGNVSCPMIFTNAAIDHLYQVGAEGSGLEQVFHVITPFFVTGLASVYTGLCIQLSEEAVTYAKERVYPDGQALSDIETVQIHLSKIYTMANAAKQTARDAAKAGANQEADALLKILSARIFASESVIECSRLAMRVGGGKAYNKMGNFERILRDSYASQIMAPSVDVLITWLGKSLVGLPIL